MPRRSSSYHRLWKYSLALIIVIMMELGLGIADIIIKCPICKETSYIPAACFALPVWTPVLLIGTSALGLMTGPESSNRNKHLRWCLVLSFISIAVCLVVIGWCVTNIVQSVSTGLLADIGMKSIALAALIIIVSLIEICLFIAFSLNSIDLIDKKKGDSEDGSGLSMGPVNNKGAGKKSNKKQWIFDHNATLLNLPKTRPQEETKATNAASGNSQEKESSQIGSRSKRPTVMELMRTHFNSNKPLLLPTPGAAAQSPKESNSVSNERRLSGEYDNAAPQASTMLQTSTTPQTSAMPQTSATPQTSAASQTSVTGKIGARDSFQAIKAFFDGNPDQRPGDSSSLPGKPKQTVAEIHVISNNALMGKPQSMFTHRDGGSELNTIPKFVNMRLPPAHGNHQARHGLQRGGVDNAKPAKVTFMNSFERR